MAGTCAAFHRPTSSSNVILAVGLLPGSPIIRLSSSRAEDLVGNPGPLDTSRTTFLFFLVHRSALIPPKHEPLAFRLRRRSSARKYRPRVRECTQPPRSKRTRRPSLTAPSSRACLRTHESDALKALAASRTVSRGVEASCPRPG